jgi:hypothetical protein
MNTVIIMVLATMGLRAAVEIPELQTKSLRNVTYEQTQKPIFDEDDGGGLSFEEDRPRIDRFADAMKRNRSAELYVIAYGGLISYKDEAKIRLKCIQQYLIKTHKIARSRLKFIDGGYRVEVSVRLFLVNSGDPKPTPYSTVNREAVKMTKVPKTRCG